MIITRIRSISLLIAAALWLVACGSGSSEPAPADTSVSSGEEEPVQTGEGRPVVLGSDGVPENCPIRVGDLCYDRAEDACAAAGCAPPAACRTLESYPAQVQCDG